MGSGVDAVVGDTGGVDVPCDFIVTLFICSLNTLSPHYVGFELLITYAVPGNLSILLIGVLFVMISKQRYERESEYRTHLRAPMLC